MKIIGKSEMAKLIRLNFDITDGKEFKATVSGKDCKVIPIKATRRGFRPVMGFMIEEIVKQKKTEEVTS